VSVRITPYIDGESLYSYLCRIHYLSATHSWKQTNCAVFGKMYVRLHPSLPAHIATVANRTKTNPLRLLYKATSYPLTALFMPTRSRITLAREMYSDSGLSISAAARVAPNRLSQGHYLKSCPLCCINNEQEYGITLWRTQHQLLGVTACPIHGCLLEHTKAGEGGVNHSLILPTVKLVTWLQRQSLKLLSAGI